LSKNLIRSLPSLAFHNLRSLVNLSLARNEISRLDDGAFFGCESLLALNLSQNHIRTISDEWLFGLNGLQELDLSYNHIASFDANSWKQCSELRWLSLHRNQLHFLPSGAFRLLPRLEYLRLSGNSIESLHKTAMTGLDHLNELDLSSNLLAVCLEDNAMLYNTSLPFLRSLKFRDNQLRVIPSRAFERFPALEHLDLADNPITTIHPGAFSPLQLQELYLDSSALLCDCHLAWFSSWFVSSKLSRRTVHTRCAHPIPLSGIDVFAIDSNNLTCVDDSPRARIIEHPATSVSTLVGGQARFTCSGYGHAPLQVEWRVIENGRPRTLEPDSTTIMNVNHSAIVNGTINGQELANAELLLLDVSMSDKAEYQCVVRNRFAAEHSIRSVLKIFQVPIFSNEPDDMSLLVGQNAKIMCAATGIPPPVIKWSKDGGASFPAALQHRLFVRPNDDHLYVVNVTTEDQGVYTCHAVNEAGAIQASATLRIFGILDHIVV
uniref:Ig-like domain-containing protein n=1 Tax=Haemonchus placei TaxID=6290 RepID=A0A158QRI1_HAEPC